MTEQTNQAIENSEVTVAEPIINEEANVEETPPVDDSPEESQEAPEDNNEESNEESEDSEEDNQTDEDSDDEHDEKFPKKAERALERRNKKINKLRAREAELLAKQAELEQKLEAYTKNPELKDKQAHEDFQPEGLREPQEDDFEDYASYLEAKGEYKVRKELAAKEAEAQQQEFQQSQQQWVQERAAYVDERAAKAIESIPELNGLYKENQDIIEGYNDSIKIAFLEADKPELAFYALAKEGRLEELESMSPMKVSREIALAEIRGEKLSKTRPVSKAPAPIKPKKGTATRQKSIADMSPSELIAYSKKIKQG